MEKLEGVMRVRKRPLEVQAVRWMGPTGGMMDLLSAWGVRVEPAGEWSSDWTLRVWVEPEQSWVLCPVGHYIIRGVRGEFYPCAPDVFEESYEVLEQGGGVLDGRA